MFSINYTISQIEDEVIDATNTYLVYIFFW